MSSSDNINLFNRFSLQGFGVQSELVRTNNLMMFPNIKEGTSNATKSTIYSFLKTCKLTNSVDASKAYYTINFEDILAEKNTIYADDIICEYIDISRSLIVSPESSFPFGCPTCDGEIVTGYIDFIFHKINITTKGDWHRYEALLVINIVISDEKMHNAVKSFPYFPLEYSTFNK